MKIKIKEELAFIWSEIKQNKILSVLYVGVFISFGFLFVTLADYPLQEIKELAWLQSNIDKETLEAEKIKEANALIALAEKETANKESKPPKDYALGDNPRQAEEDALVVVSETESTNTNNNIIKEPKPDKSEVTINKKPEKPKEEVDHSPVVESVKTERELLQIEFEVIRKEDNTIWAGHEKTIQEGEMGEREKLITINLENEIEVGRSEVMTTIREPKEKIISVGTKVGYVDSSSDELFVLINDFRQYSGLPAFTRSGKLDGFAKTRAKEVSQDYGSRRPDGSLWYTVGAGSDLKNETLLQNKESVSEVLNSWSQSQVYSQNLKSSSTSGGIAVYHASDGIRYWVLLTE